MRILLTTILLSCFSLVSIKAQSYYLGGKVGYGMNMQIWNSFERDMIFTPLVDVYTETYDEMPSRLYASFGYRTRGSSVRGRNFNSFYTYKFQNLSLEAGGKRLLSMDKKFNPYYSVGARLEYTLSSNLNASSGNIFTSLVDDEYVNKWNYGVSVGGGFEYAWTDTRVLFVEVCINPDLSKQYEQLATASYTDPNGVTYTIQKEEVRNVSIELKLGIKFLSGYFEE